MEFITNYYIGASVSGVKRVIRHIKRNTPLDGIYLVCFDMSGISKNMMEIIHSRYLFMYEEAQRRFVVAAVANGKQEAVSAAVYLIKYFMKNNPGYDFTRLKGWYLNEGT